MRLRTGLNAAARLPKIASMFTERNPTLKGEVVASRLTLVERRLVEAAAAQTRVSVSHFVRVAAAAAARLAVADSQEPVAQ